MYRERFAFRAEGAHAGRAGHPARQGEVRRDLPEKRGDLSQGGGHHHAGRSRRPVQAGGDQPGLRRQGPVLHAMESQASLSPGGGGGLLSAARGATEARAAVPGSSSASRSNANAAAAPASEMGRIESALRSGRLLVIMPLFLLLGLGLAFTPCVLPMVPILSFIIVGEGREGNPAARLHAVGCIQPRHGHRLYRAGRDCRPARRRLVGRRCRTPGCCRHSPC